MKDIILYVRITDMMHMCESLAREGHPESDRLMAASGAFKQIMDQIRKRVESNENRKD